MRFTTRLTLLFGLVLVAFLVSTLPVTAGLFRGAVGVPAQQLADWEKVTALWSQLDADTQEKTMPLMSAVTQWRSWAATPSLESDSRYLRFQTAFLMFSAFQAIVLFVLVWLGLRVLMAPVRNMTKVVERLKSGETEARLPEGGGSEWRALAQQFNSMLDQNQTLNRLQGWQEVAAFLSHQIKNPLTSIGFAEQNVRQLVPDLPPLAAENLNIIGDQSRRINTLVRRLRDLTSFEEMKRARVEFGPWVKAWAAGRQREGELWTLSVADVGWTSLVPLLCEQALDNLLTNSREAAQDQGPLSLEVSVSKTKRWIEVVWSDSNRLADPAALGHIGSARFTTKKEGSGLGVFFVRRTAELHGGTLEAALSPRGGLCLTLTIEGEHHGPNSHR